MNHLELARQKPVVLVRIVTLALGLLGVGSLGSVRSQEADWRVEAEARIEQFRKADLQVHVTDAKGQAVEGATISVRMKRHAFGFGTAVNERRFVDLVNSSDPDERADGEIYREKIETLFNKAVLEFKSRKSEGAVSTSLNALGVGGAYHHLIFGGPLP